MGMRRKPERTGRRRRRRKSKTAASSLLLGDSSLRADRSLTFEDLLVLVLDGLWDREGMAAGIGDTAEGALKVESMMLRVAATWGKAVVWDMRARGSGDATKAASESMADVIM